MSIYCCVATHDVSWNVIYGIILVDQYMFALHDQYVLWDTYNCGHILLTTFDQISCPYVVQTAAFIRDMEFCTYGNDMLVDQ